MNQYKTCPQCKQTKPHEQWPKNASKKDGLASCCKTCHAKNSADWRKNNPEEQLRRSREQYSKSRTREIARRKTRYLQNRPDELKKRKENYRQNAEKYRQASRDWRKNNKELFESQWRKARAQRASVRTEKYTTKDVLNLYGSNCYLCNEPIDLEAPRWTAKQGWERGLHIDHVVRIADGGADTLENVRPTHGACNLSKH